MSRLALEPAPAPLSRRGRGPHVKDMRNTAISLAILVSLALAACAGRPDQPPVPRVSAESVDYGEAVEVRISDLTPSTRVGEIRLLAPDGRAFAAESRRTLRGVAGTSARPSVGVGATGGSQSGVNPGISLSLPLLNWSWARADERRIRAVVARIPVPADYRTGEGAWHVEVELIDAVGQETTRRTRAPS